MGRDISKDLRETLKALRLGRLLPLVPERLRQARERKLDPEDVLLTVLADEVQRRAQQRVANRAKKAGLSPELVIDAWDASASITFDRDLLHKLLTCKFVDAHHHVLIMGPVGVGKTMLAHALGHRAVEQDRSVLCFRADRLFHHLKACRLDDSHASEIRRLSAVDVLIIDDLAQNAMDERETNDLYELVTARHRKASMIVTTNRDPSEWMEVLADQLHDQALVDRFVNNAYDLVIEGESYRKRQKPGRPGSPADAT